MKTGEAPLAEIARKPLLIKAFDPDDWLDSDHFTCYVCGARIDPGMPYVEQVYRLEELVGLLDDDDGVRAFAFCPREPCRRGAWLSYNALCDLEEETWAERHSEWRAQQICERKQRLRRGVRGKLGGILQVHAKMMAALLRDGVPLPEIAAAADITLGEAEEAILYGCGYRSWNQDMEVAAMLRAERIVAYL